MFGWIVNREFEATGFIPEEVLELDDLVLAENRNKLIEIYEAAKASAMPTFVLEVKDLDNKMLASWSWYFIKKTPNTWQFLTRTGKYAHIFEEH